LIRSNALVGFDGMPLLLGLEAIIFVVSWKLLDTLPKTKNSDSDESETMELDDEAHEE
jgi:hypothetical protein